MINSNKILITAVRRQPKITLRDKTIMKENIFNFGTIIYFDSWAEAWRKPSTAITYTCLTHNKLRTSCL